VGRVRVAGFSLSMDGFGAGPEQSLQDPLGKRGRELHRWFVGTKTFKAMFGEGGGSEGVDETFAHRSMDGFGAFILGRNMFGPVRGALVLGDLAVVRRSPRRWRDDEPRLRTLLYGILIGAIGCGRRPTATCISINSLLFQANDHCGVSAQPRVGFEVLLGADIYHCSRNEQLKKF
jgi:hypothetical protein